MGSPRFKKRYLVLVLGVLLVSLLTGVFWFRAPVLLVTDAPFNALYGIRRAGIKRLETTLKMMRQIKPVLIGENAGPDMVLFAVEEAHSAPYGVLFPYRYYEGAERYIAQFPHIPVFILGGRNRDPQVPGGIFVGTDTKLDLYRAGLCAGIFAQHEGSRDGEVLAQGEILFFQNEGIAAEYREAFSMGLQEQGFTKEPKYLNIKQDYTDSIQNVSCVVMQGQATLFLERNLEIPVILFSWIDPDVTSRAVKLVVDDSPWAVAGKTIAMIPGRQGEVVPSDWVFPGQRLVDKEVLSRLKKVLLRSIL
ncbi:MAG: hypothetical protein LBP88_03160 [Treponema sp.]|jgi:hypothetical protein|nr:hypothetical protein [Treponema sp.]